MSSNNWYLKNLSTNIFYFADNFFNVKFGHEWLCQCGQNMLTVTTSFYNYNDNIMIVDTTDKCIFTECVRDFTNKKFKTETQTDIATNMVWNSFLTNDEYIKTNRLCRRFVIKGYIPEYALYIK